MRVHIYILASAPTCIAAPRSFIKINHIRTSAANKADTGPHPGEGRVWAQETHGVLSQD